MFAGQCIEDAGAAFVDYFDCQVEDIATRDLSGYDSYGISIMGAQNVAPGAQLFNYLSTTIDAERIYIGGQGAEGLTSDEFKRVFPRARQVSRSVFVGEQQYWDVCLERQLDKFPAAQQRLYFQNELTLLVSQGCQFGCSFCGAQTRQRERFFSTRAHLEAIASRAKAAGINALRFYCTSLDFFQQALPGGNLSILAQVLKDVIDVRERFNLTLELRALTRADSYNLAMASDEIRDLVRAAGFTTFGFGADGAASSELLRAMKKGTKQLRSELLLAFQHAEAFGLVPEILYVFGIPEDTPESLAATRDLCEGLLQTFESSTYRGFPAKNAIPGNRNWARPEWRASAELELLLTQPQLFASLGFETLANPISHSNAPFCMLVNRFAVEMSHMAHCLGRAQSYLTLPDIGGIPHARASDILDDTSLAIFKEIAGRYAPDIIGDLSYDTFIELRREINLRIPKDK